MNQVTKNRLFDVARVQVEQELEATGAKRDIVMQMMNDADFEPVLIHLAQVLLGLVEDEIDVLVTMKNNINEIFGEPAGPRLVRVEDAEPNDYGITVAHEYQYSAVLYGSLCVNRFEGSERMDLANKYAQALRVGIASGELEPQNIQTILNAGSDPVEELREDGGINR